MKIAIEIDSSEDIKEEYKAVRMIKADSMYAKMWDIKDIIRQHNKYDKPAEECLGLIQDIVQSIDFDEDGWV